MQPETGRGDGASREHVFYILGLLFCTVKLGFLSLFAIQAQFVMDEMALTSVTQQMTEGLYTVIDPVKTVLHVFFYGVMRGVTESSQELLTYNRLQGLVVAVATIVLVALVARRLFGDWKSALFSACLLLSFSNFTERAFRIRSEPLAVFFPAVALWIGTGPRGGSPVASLMMGVFIGLSFLTTQKSAYYLAAFGLAVVVESGIGIVKKKEKISSGFLKISAFVLGWGITLIAYAVAFRGLKFASVLKMIFVSPLQAALTGQNFYGNLRVYVQQTLERNQLPYALCLAGLVLVLLRFVDLSREMRMAAVVTVSVTALVFSNNQPWPYVFLMALPFLSLWGVAAVREIVDSPAKGNLALIAVLMMFSLSFGRDVGYLRRDNFDQIQVLRQTESLLAPGDRYLDGVGMVPTRRWAGRTWLWDAMARAEIRREAAAGSDAALEEIFRDQPKVWVFNYRLRELLEAVGPFIQDAYVRVYPNVFLAGVEVREEGAARWVCRWKGRYALYDGSGNPLDAPYKIDGSEVRGPQQIEVGEHRVELGKGVELSRAFLLPAGLALAGPLPAVGPPKQLYNGVYD